MEFVKNVIEDFISMLKADYVKELIHFVKLQIQIMVLVQVVTQDII